MNNLRRMWQPLAWVFFNRLIFLLIAFATLAKAAELPVSPVDVDGFIAEVLSRNPDLASQHFRVRARNELVASAGALDDPRFNYAFAPSSFGDTIPSDFGNALGVRHNIQLSQVIPWPGKRALRVEKMTADAEAASQTYSTTRVDLIAETRSLWGQWWYINAALESNNEQQRLTSEQVSVTQTRYASGAGLQQDLLKLQTFAAQLQHQHVVLEQQRRRLQSRLNYLISQPASTALLPPSIELTTPPLPQRSQLEHWLLQTQPLLLELQAQSQASLISQRLTEKEDYPDLQFTIGYNELWNEPSLRLQVGVSLNIPLDFGKRSARKSAAQFEYHSAQMAVKNKRNELLSALESQLASYDQAVHGIHLIETELLPSSRQLLNASLANYEGGGGNFNDLIDAQEQLLNTQLLLLNSYAEEFTAVAEIDRLTGGQLWSTGAQQ